MTFLQALGGLAVFWGQVLIVGTAMLLIVLGVNRR